jgi:hypothetical protein
VIQLADTEDKSAKKWNDMPVVTSVNPIPLASVKPGATTLLTGLSDRRQEQIVLAYQRYGKGKAVAFPIQDSSSAWTASPIRCRSPPLMIASSRASPSS